MAKKTRLSSEGFGTRRTSSFAGRGAGSSGPHPVIKITRLGSTGYATQRNLSFSGRLPSGGGPGGAHPVGKITRLGAEGFGTQRGTSFAGRLPSGGGGPGNPHPVSRITRLSHSGHATRRCGSFAGKFIVSPGGGRPGLVTFSRLGTLPYGVELTGSFANKAVFVPPPAGSTGRTGGSDGGISFRIAICPPTP